MYLITTNGTQNVLFLLEDATGNPITGKVDANFSKFISKNGNATFSAMTVTITEVNNGYYQFTLSSSHTDTVGILTIYFTCAGAKQVNLQFGVEPISGSVAVPSATTFPRYRHTTRSDFRSGLKQASGDLLGVYWPDSEWNTIINEALLTFGALSGHWKEEIFINTALDKRLYDIFVDTTPTVSVMPTLTYQTILDWLN